MRICAVWPAALLLLAQAAIPASAQPAAGPEPKHADLPITRLVLYSSGVGYYLREGSVSDTARVDLQFPDWAVNDLLKSLVVSDKGGRVGFVTYDNRLPAEQAQKNLSVDLTGNVSLPGILAQLQGEGVEVTGGPTPVTGQIVGVTMPLQVIDRDRPPPPEQLHLLTADGLQTVPLKDVRRVRFLKREVEQAFRKSLEVAATAAKRNEEWRTISLLFSGTGPRTVRIGYLLESPMWKTSYRLSLEPDGKAFLQGWAMVENTTDEDWSRVRLALVAGRPISYRMNLYDPLFVPRPMVEPDIFAGLRPPDYQPDMRGPASRFKDEAQINTGLDPGTPPPPPSKPEDKPRLPVAIPKPRPEPAPDDQMKIGQGQGVESAASTANLGEHFQYQISEPVTLPRQKSAMLPIVNEPVEARRVSIYNQGVHVKYPLFGLRFKNATALHLMQGPVTVLDGSDYAGEGRLPDLKPKQEQLLSYAVDLGTEVDPGAAVTQSTLQTVKVVKGVLTASTRHRQSRTYRVLNRGAEARTVLIEHPVQEGWSLAVPAKPAEQARDVYRFAVTAEPNKPVTLEVVLERPVSQETRLVEFNDETVRFFQKTTASSPAVQTALAKALELKGALASTQRDIEKEHEALKAITEDQSRMRANLERVPPTSDAYKRYLKKFDEQETEIEKRQAHLKELRETVERQRRAFEEFVQALSVE